MEKMDVNQFIASNLRDLAKMSISALKKLLLRVQKSRNEQDKQTANIIKAVIEKKKKEYPVIAQKNAYEREMKRAVIVASVAQKGQMKKNQVST